MRTLFALSLSLLVGCGVPSAEFRLTTPGFMGHKSLTSWEARRARQVVMQAFDYSCGAASLATLCRYYFEDDVTESQVVERILAELTDDEIRNRQLEGLSLLDLKNAARRLGYQAAGVRLSPESLAKLKGPIIVHLVRGEDRHFAVLRGVSRGTAFLADPMRGNVRLSLRRFLAEWSGSALILGKQGFGAPEVHPLAITARDRVRPELTAVRRALVR